MLCRTEWIRHRLGDTYWLYVVWDCASTPRIVPVQDPAGSLGARVEELVEVKGFRVPAEAIVAAAGGWVVRCRPNAA